METPTDIKIYSILKKYLPAITDEQVHLIQNYHTLLLDWNQKINLVSRKEEESIWSRHVIGSISFLFQFGIEPFSEVVDIGTGGGLPGIPMAILYPGAKFVLIDSIKKKTMAVEEMAKALKLPNVEVVWGRAEELSQYREFQHAFDYIVSRAVAPVRDIMKWCKPFIRKSDADAVKLEAGAKTNTRLIGKGTYVFLKGGDLTDEISHAKIKFKPADIQMFEMPLLTEIPEITDKRLIVIKP